ncbi:hypothetical protein HYX14_02820 [Candidatus Woesearchaeota archaeon]|nr:hypothetical protein [Candidatus Woesearchaeota archaeon]
MSEGHVSHQSHTRFYVVLITIVIGVIFIVLMLDNNKNQSLSGALAGTVGDERQEKDTVAGDSSAVSGSASAATKIKAKSGRDLAFTLAFSDVPTVKSKAKIQSVAVTFNQVPDQITINDDKLELSNLQQVTLEMLGYEGALEFSGHGLSVDGTAGKIKVNDVALVSKGKIDIAFSGLPYTWLKVEDLQMSNLPLGEGDGNVQVGERLNYELKNDDVTVNDFEGALTVDRNAQRVLALAGTTSGIEVSGDVLGLNIR